jgi:hypothetical protein
MHLGSVIAHYTETPFRQIMLLRHSNRKTTALLEKKADLNEYTCVQPKNSRYDYFCDGGIPIRTVGVIVYDRLFSVIQIQEIEKEGTTRDLVSPEFRQFDIEQGYPELAARRYRCQLLPFPYLDHAVAGWTSKRSAVARYGGLLFDSVQLVE